MKALILSAVIATLPLLFANCKKETTSNDASTFSFRMKAANPSSALNRMITSGRTEAALVQWSAGTASATQLKFEAKNNSGEVEFKQNVQQQIDLFASNSVLGSLTVPAGSYSEVEFKAFLAPAGSNPALVLDGSFTSSGVTTPIRFLVSSNVELKAEKANVVVAAGTTYSALNTLDLSQLTRDVSQAELQSAVRTNGTILISANSNTSLYSKILANLNRHHGEAEVEHD